MLLQQYEAKLKLLEKQNAAGTTNEKTLWHGTGNDAVASINTYGFNRSYCGKNGTHHGKFVAKHYFITYYFYMLCFLCLQVLKHITQSAE